MSFKNVLANMPEKSVHRLQSKYKWYEIVTMSGEKYKVTGELLDMIANAGKDKRFIRHPITGELINLSSIDSTPFLRDYTQEQYKKLPLEEQEKAFCNLPVKST